MYIIYHIIHELIKYQSNYNCHRRHFLSCQNYENPRALIFQRSWVYFYGYCIIPTREPYRYVKQICLT